MSRVLADNWSLQNISELFTNGLGNDTASIIEIDKDRTTHKYEPVDYGIIRIEALFDFLNDVILKDEIIVDDRFLDTWKLTKSPLEDLLRAGIIQPFPFLAKPEILSGPTAALIKRLCVTSTLEAEHALNSSVWEVSKKTPYPVLSSTLWGGAGMLARSHIYECNYTPHPLRRRLFLSTGVFMSKPNAGFQLRTLIDKKRIQVFGKQSNTGSLHSAFLQLAPIPLRVIEESESIEDIFRVALQLRSELKELREWLNQFQNAIDAEDVPKILRHEAVLESVSRHVDRLVSGSTAGRVEMSVNLGMLKFAIKGDPLNTIHNLIGVRSTINSLVFDKPGQQALKKLIRLLGDDYTSAGYNVYHHFVSNDSGKNAEAS
jgi:hypothetical protein